MFLELLIAGHLATYQPTPLPEPAVQPETIQVIEEPQPAPAELPPTITEPSLEEKIKTNYYNCDESTHFIRADNAQCLAKPVQVPQLAQTARIQPVRSSYATPGNTYQAGQCVWYVKNRIPSLPNNMGSAYNWINHLTKTSARPGVVGWRGNHVVYVEAVNGNTVTISEMNYNWTPYATRTIDRPINYYTYLY